jgi:hypothetical protein
MAPRNPYKLLKTDELTDEQLKRLRKVLRQREDDLKRALNAVEEALVLVSKSLSQTGESKYLKKILRTGKKRKATRPRRKK